MQQYDVAIIGAGTAGLSARREVAKVTDRYVVIDDGPLGTTCARVGCMPSKVLIQVANDFHRRHRFAQVGIGGADGLEIDTAAVMTHVRALRDRFVRAVVGDMASWTDTHLLRARARFVDDHTLAVGDAHLRAERIIIAAGSTPVMPGAWRPFAHRLIDTDDVFELPELPERVAVVGLGVIGLELGQALHRLGVEVTGVTLDTGYGGLSDPALQAYAHATFGGEFPVHLAAVSELSETADGLTLALADGTALTVDAALLAMGRRPNLQDLGIDSPPAFDSGTFRVEGKPWFLVGDVNDTRPILHEAADEGRIAGYNAVRSERQGFQRRTPLAITFADPNIALVGQGHRALTAAGVDFVTGQVSFEGQGRAIVKLKETGRLHVYVDRASGLLLGAELFAPDGEHLAHLLAWAIAAGMTVWQTLSLPFYHPVTAEGLRTALRDAVDQLDQAAPLEVLRCADPPVGVRA